MKETVNLERERKRETKRGRSVWWRRVIGNTSRERWRFEDSWSRRMSSIKKERMRLGSRLVLPETGFRRRI